MSSDGLVNGYAKLPAEAPPLQSSRSFHADDAPKVFDELPKATVVFVSRPDAGDFSPIILTYTIELQYKQFKWKLVKTTSQVFYLHFALKKRAIIEEFYEKHEQVKEWLQNLGIGDQSNTMHDDDEIDEDSGHLYHEENISTSKRNIPSSAAFPVIRPSLRWQRSVSDRAKEAMQGYLSHFFGNLDIVNSREVCKFLEVSSLSFQPKYGLKMKEGYVMVKHLANTAKGNAGGGSCLCNWFSCCNGNWLKVWAVLKPGFMALLEDPFKTKPLDVIAFDVFSTLIGNNGESCVSLARETKEKNPLRFGLEVSCGNRVIKLRLKSRGKVRDWIASVNDAGLKSPEGWCYPHRFGSYAPSRGLTDDGSLVQWFIDGNAAFNAIASSLEEATSEIFITGWWLCPELYLRRPFDAYASSRMDTLLEEKAKQGVQVYVLLYKEVALALKINSMYSKRKLVNIHENVKVLRYPDHFSTGVYLWSHHEKIVVIDYKICFIGGLDLCFGRYDTPEHLISDYPSVVWPGKDYYNPRESEPNSWEDTMKDELDRKKYPRMPWHDVQCALWGPPCRDVARHFVMRWNYAKRSKASNQKSIPLLMPQQCMVLPHYLGSRNIDGLRIQNENGVRKPIEISKSFSCQDVPLLLPQEGDGQPNPYEFSEINDSTISNNCHCGPTHIVSAHSLPLQWIKDVHHPAMKTKKLVNERDTRQHRDQAVLDSLENEWRESQVDADLVSFGDEIVQAGPLAPCRCQVIRSVGEWSAGMCQKEDSIHNAYISLIEKSKHFIYIENQFFISGFSGDDIIKNRVLEALYMRIMQAHTEHKCFRIIVLLPLLPGFQGGLDDGGAATVRALVHWQYRTISRGPNSIMQKLYDVMGEKAHDYISFFGLRAYGKLCAQELVATNQVYVHSKLMIVDDRITLIGSANINDRSLLGSRDSEIGLVIEDKEFVESSMNGRAWKAGKFSHSLRLSLWCEHLGLSAKEMHQVIDPVEDASYKNVWVATAKANTEIYHEVFACIPNDSIKSRAAIRQTVSYWKEKLGHTTIDLGIAPKKLVVSYQNDEKKEIDPMERLQSVKGHLVCFPLEFMSQEDLRPFFNETEFYAAQEVFH